MLENVSVAWRALSWATSNPDEIEDVDEPPELRSQRKAAEQFRKSAVSRPAEKTSLLTRAIMAESDDGHDHHSNIELRRRRSMTSNVSLASTADLTSDSGLTSPARTNTPSPPIPDVVVSHMQRTPAQPKITLRPQEPRKRSIQFACAKPQADQSAAKNAPVVGAARRPCIKFACPTQPASTQSTPPRPIAPPRFSPRSKKVESPSTPKKAPPSPRSATPRPTTPRQSGHSRKSSKPIATRPKFLRANSNDVGGDGSYFHEFACEKSREQDWIRQENTSVAKCKLTIDDTLTKENHIRRIAKEAEEEAEMEDEDEEAKIDGKKVDDEDDDDEEENYDDDDEDEDDEDEEADEESDFSLSEGYRTDEESGFASDESDEEDNMVLWTLSKSPAARPKPNVPVGTFQRPSIAEQQQQQSDDSSTTTSDNRRRSSNRRIKPQSDPVDLPDSTDFVCGTLDEDRPLEEAYLESLAARRNHNLRVIPQDIDPSFPASEPEDEDDEDIYNPVHHDSDDDEFLHGRMEDLHHETDRSRRRRKTAKGSPRKYHSPPPKRHASPAPKAKARGRSPRPLFDRHSPRRVRSPAPKALTTPNGSPRQGNHIKFNLAARPDLTMTKSLPRPGAMFGQKQGRHMRREQDSDIHLRGAIDIVKGLEQKRQRRKEKFYQKYCNRARRGQIPERKTQPGRGAERMKELGLLMAGKKDQGNYVISI